MRIVACIVAALVLLQARPAASQGTMHSQYFITSDGVRLHYLEAGPTPATPSSLCRAGPCRPGSGGRRFRPLRGRYHVVAFDPRGQGDSDAPASGYEPGRRSQDIAELIANLEPVPVLLVGWSLGVLDTLAYVREHGDEMVAGLVLVDNSVGEEPPPPPMRRAAPSPGTAARHRHASLRAWHVPSPAERELSGSPHRGHAPHARTREPGTAVISVAARLVA